MDETTSDCDIDESPDVDSVNDDTNDMDDFSVRSHIKRNKRRQDDLDDVDLVHTTGKKKRKKVDGVVKPPTAEEMTRLRETENLFHSNLFRLQIEELINEVRPRKADRKAVKTWIERFKTAVGELEDLGPCALYDDSWVVKNLGLCVPLPHRPADKKGNNTTFQFAAPIAVTTIGSFSSATVIGPHFSVDIALTMPKSCFHKGDHFNERYHRKRALYLCCVAHRLATLDLVPTGSLAFSCRQGDPAKPTLLCHPAGKLAHRVLVCVSAVPEEGMFDCGRFSPDKNNVKPAWWRSNSSTATEQPGCSSAPATPMYNASVLEDMVTGPNEQLLTDTVAQNTNARDAIMLLKVWLRQRQLDQGYGAFGGHLMSLFVAHLYAVRKLNKLMSSYQVVRNVWLALGQSDWRECGPSLASRGNVLLPSVFHSHYAVVFVDCTGFLNLAARLSLYTYCEVRREAEAAVRCLDDSAMNCFQALFMTPVPFLQDFDHIIKFADADQMVRTVIEHCPPATLLDHRGAPHQLFGPVVLALLGRALGGRVSRLRPQLLAPSTWPVATTPPRPSAVTLGIKLDPAEAMRLIDRGPEANLPEAEEFRELWGTRSELRRFRDSATCEAVVWAAGSAPLSARRTIVRDMVHHVLEHRLGVPPTSYVYIADQCEEMLRRSIVYRGALASGTGEEASLAVLRSFDDLARQLRGLTGLPLGVVGVEGASAVHRYTDPCPPLPCPRPAEASIARVNPNRLIRALNYIQPIEGVIELSMSSKWPNDAEAVRRVRAAFNIQIAKRLGQQANLTAQPFLDYVDIAKDGYVFRLRVVYGREVALMKETTAPDGTRSYRHTAESLVLERQAVHLPQLTSWLHGLSQQYGAFGPTAALAHRWLCSQLLDASHFPPIATELLIASIFLSPHPLTAPVQPRTAFTRFLAMLANTDWHHWPVIVNFNGTLTSQEVADIESQFRSERDSFPSLFIATPSDRSGSLWTREAPSVPILHRVGQLAAQSLAMLMSMFLGTDNPSQCRPIFRPPLQAYDLLIELKPRLNARASQGVDFVPLKPVSLPSVAAGSRLALPVTGFDPFQCYLRELRENYGEVALFFHDTYGGQLIGVVFRPAALQESDFKVSHINYHKPSSDGKKLKLNIDAIVEDFATLGTGLIAAITRQGKLQCS